MTRYLPLLLILFPASALAAPDWTDYRKVLERHVTFGEKNGVRITLVDYPAIAEDDAYWRTLRTLANHPPAELDTREERLAFYINAYNILAIKLVVDNWPLDDIRRIGHLFRSVWRMPAGTAAGTEMSLDDIEHDILRRIGDTRIHMAIVCASVSCPDLRTEPYTGERLEEQLEDQVQQFLANPGKGVRIEDDAVRVSKIFHWFREDFELGGGVGKFIADYRPDLPPGMPIKANLPYDWSLNFKRQ